MRDIITKILLIMSLALTTIFPQEIYGATVEKRVLFPKGKGKMTFRGKLPREFDYDAYVFSAKKGRYITVKLITADSDAYVAVYETKTLGPDEDAILPNDKRSIEWTGQLPVGGEYSVQVYDASENTMSRAAYTIEITLN
ncbi:MAG TPA: hypothetical protein PLP21_16770 [Pyrinomonadaceae bacterium]|nr:hypothetical protein [Acidobacteriota bacterium]HQZ97976.1 hypothetical protein [Pyrinomonadaceae bacterium]